MADTRRSWHLRAAITFIILILGLAACQAETAIPATASVSPPAVSATAAPTATPAPTPTTAPPAGVFWVDPTRDLGEISKLVLGVNHGPWSDLSPSNLEPAKASGITFLRWPGGSWGDQNDIQTYMIDNYLFQARMMGAEPSITVRLPNNTPEKAAALVKYTNIDKKYGVIYWSIGNEPSLYENDTNLKSLGLNAVTSAQKWREIAQAMKAVDPSIKLFGPDIHQFKGDPAFDPKDNEGRYYLQEFLKRNGDLVDIVTVHRYPFPVCQTCSNPTPDELFANTPEWDAIIPNLKTIVKEVTGKDLPVGVTEYNSYYTRAMSGETTPDSFDNAIWLADVLGRMIRNQPKMLAYWLLKDNSSGHGLMTSYDLRPSYYVFQLYKQFGSRLLQASSADPMVSVFAAKRDDGSVTVIFVNRSDQLVKKPFMMEGGPWNPTEAYLLDKDHPTVSAIEAGLNNTLNIELTPRSVLLRVFKP